MSNWQTPELLLLCAVLYGVVFLGGIYVLEKIVARQERKLAAKQ